MRLFFFVGTFDEFFYESSASTFHLIHRMKNPLWGVCVSKELGHNNESEEFIAKGPRVLSFEPGPSA